MIRRIVLGLLISSAVIGHLCAAPLEPYTPPIAPPAPSSVEYLLRLVGLTLVTLMICSVGMVLTKRMGSVSQSNTSSARLTYEGTLGLQRRSALHAIRVDGQRVVVAVDGSGIRSFTLVSQPFEQVLEELSVTTRASETTQANRSPEVAH